MEVDWSFIKELEGFTDKVYVPKDADGSPMGHSGATVGMGFDIGQHGITSLKELGLSQSLIDKLTPYCMITGYKAVNFLKAHPLKLTDAELDELTNKVCFAYYKAVEEEYNTYSDFTFSFLDGDKQTVICSVAYQYGSLKKKCPRFFELITKGKWGKAVEELENFGDSYTVRRKKEAVLLEHSFRNK